MKAARRHVPQTGLHEAFDLPWWRGSPGEEDPVICPHCRRWTDDYDNPDRWNLSYDDFARVHEERVKDPDFPGPLPESEDMQLSGEILEGKTCLHICPLCGWWVAEDRAVLPAKRWQLWVVTLAASAVLQEFSANDIRAPIQEVRRYLARRFDDKMSVHPRLFELTVASVFADFGYRSSATAYSKDGGVDVILEDRSGSRIGVQVKRQQGTVGVEQFRAFLGALVLGDYLRGVFVSTSRFSREATHAAQQSATRGMPIELVDANRFFRHAGLRAAQASAAA